VAVKHDEAIMDELGGMDAIRERLLATRADIVALYERDVKAGQGASHEASDDLVDRANNSYERELMFSLSNGERDSLILIEEALARLDDGLYHVCVKCTRSIGSARLKAVPSTRYCIECQELAEQGLLDE